MTAILAMWNGASTDGLADLLDPTYRGHMLGVANSERDGAAYPASITRYREAFPDVAFRVIEQFDAGDRLVTRLEARRAGALTGSESMSNGINIARFAAAGRLAEEWAIWSPWQDQDARLDSGLA